VALTWALVSLGYKPDLYFIDLEIPNFSALSKKVVEEIANRFDLNLYIEKVSNYGIKIERVGNKPPCAVCGIVKRYLMNKFAWERDYILATAHNLDDIASFIFLNIVSNKWEYLIKIRPKNTGSKEKKLATKVKPLYFIPEEWNRKLVRLLDLPFVDIDCPLKRISSQDKAKQLINEIDRAFPGFKKNLVKTITRYNMNIDEPLPNNFCKVCGFPSEREICSFCRLREYFQKRESQNIH